MKMQYLNVKMQLTDSELHYASQLNSILTIAKSESASLGKNLRQLILCDYIKKEFLCNVGKEDVKINETGLLLKPIPTRRRFIAAATDSIALS